ncbi:MAG: Crp/Fnr family transcriptional regulator, partial [Deltaproteobacteria bacterium]|nr:Crp/Fnr family transcriptional regulator [Deltaproteobacteria bacterium]
YADLSYECACDMDRARSRVRAEPGDHIATQAAISTELFFVTDGMVGLWRTDVNGRRTLVRLVHAGQSLEYLCPLGKPAPYDAIAIQTTLMCRIDGAFMVRAAREVPALAVQLLDHAREDLDDAYEMLLARNTRTVRARVAALLVDLANRYGRRGLRGIELELRLSRRDIAELVGARVETVVRAIGELENDNLVKVSGKRVVIVGRDALVEAARESPPA